MSALWEISFSRNESVKNWSFSLVNVLCTTLPCTHPEIATSWCLVSPPFIPWMEAPPMSWFCCVQPAQGAIRSHPRYLLGVLMTVLMSLSPESYSVGHDNMWLKKPVRNSLGSWIRYLISYYGSFYLTAQWKKGVWITLGDIGINKSVLWVLGLVVSWTILIVSKWWQTSQA